MAKLKFPRNYDVTLDLSHAVTPSPSLSVEPGNPWQVTSQQQLCAKITSPDIAGVENGSFISSSHHLTDGSYTSAINACTQQKDYIGMLRCTDEKSRIFPIVCLIVHFRADILQLYTGISARSPPADRNPRASSTSNWIGQTARMTSNCNGTVLVSGVSGFVGSHIVDILLTDGYSVRALVRQAKVESVRRAYAGRLLEVVEIQDIAKDDFTAALTGVTAVIHSASPLAGRGSPEYVLNATLHGSLNILRHCVKSGVKKVIITSTWATVCDPDLKQTYEGKTFDQNSWGEVSSEEIVDGKHDPLYVYLGSKILAEKAAWKFAEENGELDLATINPPFIYGPFTGFKPSGPAEMGTNAFILGLIAGSPGRPLPPLLSPYYIDVRDVARAHVAALGVPKVALGPLVEKRFIISGGAFTWKEAAEFLAETRPELKSRLPDTSIGGHLPDTLSENDVSLAANSLGLTEYVKWQKMVEDTVDDLLSLEKEWAKSA